MEKKTMNDVTDHYEQHVGLLKKIELKKLPPPIRYFGYFFITVMILSTIAIIFGIIMTQFN